MNPQLPTPLLTALFEAGALGCVAFTHSDEERPAGHRGVGALPARALASVEDAFFANSTTSVSRRQVMQRTVFERALAKVATSFGEVRVKVRAGSEILGRDPEFEDVASSLRAKVAVRRVVASQRRGAGPLLGNAEKV